MYSFSVEQSGAHACPKRRRNIHGFDGRFAQEAAGLGAEHRTQSVSARLSEAVKRRARLQDWVCFFQMFGMPSEAFTASRGLQKRLCICCIPPRVGTPFGSNLRFHPEEFQHLSRPPCSA